MASLNEQKVLWEYIFRFLRKKKTVLGSWTLEIYETTMETIYKLLICINMQPCQTNMLDFNHKKPENNATFLMGRDFST